MANAMKRSSRILKHVDGSQPRAKKGISYEWFVGGVAAESAREGVLQVRRKAGSETVPVISRES